MANTIQIKRNTSGAPSSLDAGELAVNLTDKKLWVGNNAGDGVLHLNDHLPLSGGTLTGQLYSQTIRPSANATYNLGVATGRYAYVYGVTGDFSGSITAAGGTLTGSLTGTDANFERSLGNSQPTDTTSSIYLKDTASLAAGIGGSIVFSGRYSTNNFLGQGPYVRGVKINATSADYSYGLAFGTRKNGVNASAEAARFDEDGALLINTTSKGTNTGKFFIGSPLTTGSGAIAQMNGFLRASYIITHATGTGASAHSGLQPHTNNTGNVGNTDKRYYGGYFNVGSFSNSLLVNATSDGGFGKLVNQQASDTNANGISTVSAGGNSFRLWVDSSGNRKINSGGTEVISFTASAINLLQPVTLQEADGRSTLTLVGAKTADGNYGDILGSNNSGAGRAQISFRRISNDDATGILFYTEATGASMSESMRIDSNGVTSYNDITINSDNATLRLNDTTSGSNFNIFSNGSELRMAQHNATFPGAYLNLTTGGNLGLGVTGASERLEVSGNITANGKLTAKPTAQGIPGVIIGDNTSSFTAPWTTNGTDARLSFVSKNSSGGSGNEFDVNAWMGIPRWSSTGSLFLYGPNTSSGGNELAFQYNSTGWTWYVADTALLKLSPAGTLYPYTSGENLGASTNRWNLYATSGDFSGGSDANLRLRSDSNRSGIFIDKPGTTSVMGSALVLASDESYRLGTANYYHVVCQQGGGTLLQYQGNTKFETLSNGAKVTQYLYGSDGEILAGQDSGGYYFATGAGQNINKPVFIGDNASYIKMKAGDAERFRVTTTGATVTGDLTATGWATLGSGGDFGRLALENNNTTAGTTYLQQTYSGTPELRIGSNVGTHANASLIIKSGNAAEVKAQGNLTVGGTANFGGSFTNFGGGYGATGVSISSAGNIQANGTLTVDGVTNVTDLRIGYTRTNSHTSTTAAWYNIAGWGSTSSTRGGKIFVLSYTGGSFTPVTYVIKAFKNWSGTASLILEKHGTSNYITKVRIAHDGSASPGPVYKLQVYLVSDSAGHNFRLYEYNGIGYNGGLASEAMTAVSGSWTTATERDMPTSESGISTILGPTINGEADLALTGADHTLYSGEADNELRFGRGSTECMRFYVNDYHAYFDLIQDADQNQDHYVYFRNQAAGTGARGFKFEGGPVGINTIPNAASYLHVNGWSIFESGSSLVSVRLKSSAGEWDIDNNNGTFGLQWAGGDKLTLSNSGNLTVGGSLKLSNGYSLHWDNENTRILASHASQYIRFDVGGTSNVMYATPNTLSIGAGSSHAVGGTPKLYLTGQTNMIVMSQPNVFNNSSYIRHWGTAHFQWQTYNGSNAGILELEPYGGSVGIGTGGNTPSAKLHVAASTDDGIRINSNNAIIGQKTTHATHGTQLLFWSGTDAYLGRSISGLGNGTVTSWNIRTGGADKVIINSTGLGIGGITPGRALDVDGRVLADTYGFRSDTTLRWYYFDNYSGSHFIGRGGNSYTALYDTGVLSMVWKEGKVGIGGIPSSPLTLHMTGGSYGSDATSGFIISNTSSGRATQRIRTVNDNAAELFFDVNGAARWDFSCRKSTYDYKLHLYKQASTPSYTAVSFPCMTWTQDGRVGIMDDDPGYELEVQGSISNYGDGKIIRLRSNDYIIGQIENKGTGANYDKGYFRLFDTGTAKVVIDSAGDSYFSGGSLGIGTTSPNAKLHIFGSQLGQTLNDYQRHLQIQAGLDGNTGHLEVKDVRTAAGNAWTTSGRRLQMKIDSTYMGYIQWNGSGNNYGMSFGAGATTSHPGNVNEVMRIFSGANVSIGSTSSAYGRLFVDATSNVNTAAALAVRGRDSSASYIALNVMNNADGELFSVLNNGRAKFVGAGVGINKTPNSQYDLDMAGQMLVGSHMSFKAANSIQGIGFNRNVHNGAIYSSSYHAYQIHSNNNNFEIQRYDGSGTFLGYALTCNTSGNIGIGIQSGSYKLDIGGTTPSTNNTIRLAQQNGGTAIRVGAGGGSSDVTLIRIDGRSSAGDHVGATDSSEYGFSLKYMGSRTGNANSLSLFSDNQEAVSQVEALTVMQDGAIGINTASPSAKLHVNNGSSNGDGAVYPLRLTGGAEMQTAGDSTGLQFVQRNQHNDYGGYIRLANTQSNPYSLNPRLEFGVQNTDTNALGSVSTKMMITGGGSVGIGVTPAATLHVLASAPEFRLSTASSAVVRLRTSGDNYINTGQNLGLGTASPSARLHAVSTQCDVLAESTTAGQSTRYRLKTTSREWRIGTHSGQNNNLWFYDATAAAYRFVLNPNGRCGIGTINPAAQLHVNNSSGSTTVLTEVAANSTVGFEIKKTGSTTQHWKIVDGQTVNGVLEFYDETDSLTRMAIKGDGNVGIGTVSPSAKLHINASQGWNSLFSDGTNGLLITTSSSNASLVGYDGGNYNDVQIRAKSGTQLYLKNDGLVGINTASPSYNLDIHDSTHAQLSIDGDTTSQLLFGGSTNNRLIYREADGDLDLELGDVVIATFENGGNVGIGVDPSAKLHVYDTALANIRVESNSNHAQLELKSTDSTYGSYINFLDSGTRFIQYVGPDNKMLFRPLGTSNSSNQVAITDTGSVGIGTTSPVSWTKLHVAGGIHAGNIINTDDYFRVRSGGATKVIIDGNGDSYFNGGSVGIGTTAPADLLHLSSTAPSIILDKTETGWGSLRFYKAGSQVSYIQLDGSEEMVYYQPSGLGHLFYAGGVAALKIQNDGSVGIGTNSPANLLHVSGADESMLMLQANTGSTGDKCHIGFGCSTVMLSGTNLGARLTFERRGASTGGDLSVYTRPVGGTLTERLVIRDDGDVDILNRLGVGGAHNNSYQLYVTGTSYFNSGSTQNPATLYTSQSTGGNYLLFNNASGQLGYVGWGSTGNNDLYIVNQGGSNTGAIRLYAGSSTRVLVDSDGDTDITGRLGVGGSHSNSYQLYVNGTSYFGNDVVIAGNSSTDSKNLRFHDTGGEEWYVEYNGGLRFVETGNAERFKLLDGGNIDTPAQDKYARFGRARVGNIGWSGYAGFAHRDQSTTTTYALLQSSAGATFLNSASGQTLYFRQNNADVGAVVSGNWGLGTVSPGSYKLFVNGPSYFTASGTNYAGRFKSTQAATPYGVWIEEPSSATAGYPQLSITSSGGSSTYFRVDSGGSVNIGSSKLKIGGSSGSNGQVLTTDGSGGISWTTVSGSGSGSGTVSSSTTTSSTTDGEVAIYTASTTVKQAAKLYYNGSDDSLTIGQTSSNTTARLNVVSSGSGSSYVAGDAYIQNRIGVGSSPNSSYTAFFGGNIYSNGDIGGYSKSFRIPHPTKEGMNLRHSSLEGPEIGVYQRGEIQGDTITLPDYWAGLVRDGTVTVQLTPKGSYQKLFVISASNVEIKIGEADGNAIDCYYTVYGERADIERYDVEYEGQI